MWAFNGWFYAVHAVTIEGALVAMRHEVRTGASYFGMLR
jgi:hypothetical protein